MSKTTSEAELAQKKFNELAEEPDFKEYVRMLVVTGELDESALDQMDEDSSERLADDFRTWVNLGKPKPKMPERVKKAVEVIDSIYRKKENGRQYLTYIVKGERRQRNIEVIPRFRIRADGTVDETLKVGEETKHTVEWTNELGKELLKKAKLRNPDVKLYIKGQIPFRIYTEENFFKDFDKVYALGIDKKPI